MDIYDPDLANESLLEISSCIKISMNMKTKINNVNQRKK